MHACMPVCTKSTDGHGSRSVWVGLLYRWCVCVCVCVSVYAIGAVCYTHTHSHIHTDTHTHTHTSGNADLSSIQRDYELTKYVLEGHETLAGLALKFNCRMEELKRINGIASLTSGIFFVVCV